MTVGNLDQRRDQELYGVFAETIESLLPLAWRLSGLSGFHACGYDPGEEEAEPESGRADQPDRYYFICYRMCCDGGYWIERGVFCA